LKDSDKNKGRNEERNMETGDTLIGKLLELNNQYNNFQVTKDSENQVSLTQIKEFPSLPQKERLS
jgi:hypothetical protein